LLICVKGATVQQSDLHGRHPLHYACRNGHEDIAEYLLANGSPPDHPDHDGLTPMTMAVISGKTKCVHELLEFKASVDSMNDSSIPLNLACQYGHNDIVRLLLLRHPKIVSNSEGLYPLHLASRAGNTEILDSLMQYDKGGIDVQERFSLWTPLFFAASEGHDDCVQQLLSAGASVNTLDDNGHSAIYWAAWTGHLGCMNLLFDAGASPERKGPFPSAASHGVMSGSQTVPNVEDQEIPSLSLPPPIIPSFGHNFLEKKVFVQFRLGRNRSPDSPTVQPVMLYSDASLTSAKLTISPKGCDDIVPRSVLLPLTDDDQRSVAFYVDKIENFSIDFELYPTFGSKIIGKASALGDVFSKKTKPTHSTDSSDVFCLLPIFDSRLKVIGEISFEFSIIKPFQGVQLEIGGKIETYWKSTQPLQSSTMGTPSLQSLNSGNSGHALVTASSLSGQFARVFVQVTRDLVPVAYPSWRLPVEGLDLGVSEVTYLQFRAIISKISDPAAHRSNISSVRNAQEAQDLICLCFTSLADILSALPSSVHLNLQILYPTNSERERLCIDFVPEINDFIDSILQTVFESAESSQARDIQSNLEFNGQQRNRTMLFSSFNPDICTTLNWKQPNCIILFLFVINNLDAVFFANYIGDNRVLEKDSTSPTLGTFPASQPLSVGVTTDWRCRSIRDAVKFAKSNNLLGLICQARLLVYPGCNFPDLN
jgi:CDK inhibitor PHO81